ncbi:hypothetical protein QL285_070415 [Trifolium repens]|nr:hypothetical protein QL285_070415 [Trifolium repens]
MNRNSFRSNHEPAKNSKTLSVVMATKRLNQSTTSSGRAASAASPCWLVASPCGCHRPLQTEAQMRPQLLMVAEADGG